MLNAWAAGSKGALMERVSCDENSGDEISGEDVDALVRFLFENALTLEPPRSDVKAFVAQKEAGEKSFLASAVHNYLFFRIPLIRPHRFLKRTAALTAFFFSPAWWAFVAVVAAAGGYLALRQWDLFVHTFLHFFSVQGLACYLASLVAIKIAHEFGHAYAATRYGGRVTTMGVAFLVMFPVLFTDTTDAWRLCDRRKRLVIDAAGVAVELMIAAFATLAWAFLPDGPWRSAAFFAATTSWAMSLAVNLNPLMRFDGYHFLADLTGVQNLQARSFALGRWALREALFGLGEPAPEAMARPARRGLIAFAWASWIYRFFLFLGIALLVHAIFFKALGVVLFLVEIGWFIMLPILTELREWGARRSAIAASRRAVTTVAVVSLIILVLIVPWRTTVRAPVMLEAQDEAVVHAQFPAEVIEARVKSGDVVEAGDVILETRSPDLEQQVRLARSRAALARLRLERIVSDARDRQQTTVLRRELARREGTLEALMEKRDALAVRAPIGGVVRDLAPGLHPNRWINKDAPVATIVSPAGARLRGYAPVEAVGRIRPGAAAVFVPDMADYPKRKGRVRLIAAANAAEISLPALASRHGGPIAVSKTAEALEPVAAWCDVVIELDPAGAAPGRVLKGEARIDARAESIAARIWRRVVRVIVIETSL